MVRYMSEMREGGTLGGQPNLRGRGNHLATAHSCPAYIEAQSAVANASGKETYSAVAKAAKNRVVPALPASAPDNAVPITCGQCSKLVGAFIAILMATHKC